MTGVQTCALPIYVRAVKDRNNAVFDLVASSKISDRKGFVDVKIFRSASEIGSGLRMGLKVMTHFKTEI